MKNKGLIILCASALAVAISLSGCGGKESDTRKGGDAIKGGTVTERKKNPVPEKHKEDACGKKASWSYDDTSGVLKVSGDGEMWDYIYKNENGFYDGADKPWDEYEIDKLVISDGIERIGDYAFEKCTYLYTAEISDSVTSIGDHAFNSCAFLDNVKLPDGLLEIGDYAFASCSSLPGIEIPDTVVKIGNHAFSGCGNRFFKSVDIPASVEYIGSDAFSGSEIESINVHANNKKYSSIDGVLFSKDKKELIFYPQGKQGSEYRIPDGVTKIGDSAFEYARELEYVHIPESVTEIGNYAFNGPPLKEIEIPGSVTTIGDGVFRWGSDLDEIVIPEGVKSMGDYVFAYNKAVKKVTLPASLTKIGSRAFFSTAVEEIYFGGTKEQWEALGIQADTLADTTVTFGK